MAEPNHGGADLAFVAGPVATMDGVRSVTDALAVRDGRILAVGSAAVRPLITRRTAVVDLRGRLLLPGFQDAHVHPVYGGLQRRRCDLSACESARGCLDEVGLHLRHRPEIGWILGGGWEASLFPGGTPTAAELDVVTGGRPAFLVSRDHHSAWVNSAALRRAGIDRETPDPAGGRIERDATGAPTGTLHESAVDLLRRVLPAATDREYREALLEAQRYLHARGVTAWQDAILGDYLGYADTLPPYLSLSSAGLLTARVGGALWWDRDRGLDQVDELVERRNLCREAGFRAESVKIMLDGVCENFTASMQLPYLGGHGSGLSYVDSATLPKVVSTLDYLGFQLHFHAIGDRAIRDALDAVAFARAARGMNDLRHQIAHVQVVHPSDVSRFRALGVAATIQPRWAVHDAAMTELTIPYLGHRRSRWQYPFHSLRAAGAVLAAGSDWPVSEAEPLLGVHCAVNRTEPGGSSEPFLPGEALDLSDALAAYTSGSAWVNHLDTITGSLEVGKYADLVVLDRDPFPYPTTRFAETTVDMTFVEGSLVHDSGG